MIPFQVFGIDPILPAPRNPVIRTEVSNFHPDTVGKGGLKIALMGDSLSVPFHCASVLQSYSMIFNHRRGGWLDDSVRDNGLESLFEKLIYQDRVPVSTMNLAIAGSWIVTPGYTTAAGLLGMDSMEQQVSRILMEPVFPNLILVWEGHNDADWKYQSEGRGIPASQLDQFRRDLPMEINGHMWEQLERLLARARTVDYPVAIVVYGLMNARSALETRQQVLEMKRQNPTLFPYLSDGIKSFPSLMPQYTKETTGVFDTLMASWQRTTEGLNEELRNSTHRNRIEVIYSDALSKVDLTTALINPYDGLHLRMPEGHQAISEAAYRELHDDKVLEYLGAKP